jgi:signal transduction histidine kinase
MSAARARRRPGLRREGPTVLAVALAIFVLLSGFTLLAFRHAAARSAAERRTEVVALAERLAREAPAGGSRVDALLRVAPGGSAIVVYEADGRVVDSWGHADPPPLAAAGRAPDAISGAVSITGDGAELPRGTTFAAIAPFASSGGERRLLRIDLPVTALAATRRSLAWLTPTVLALSLAAAVVVLLYVRALARPYEALLARAREAGAPVDELDELAALVATFDRALEALAARGGVVSDRSLPALGGLQEALGAEAGGGFLLLDREGVLLAATPAAAELLGIAPPPTGAALSRALSERPELVRLLEPAIDSGDALPRGAIRFEREGSAATLGVTAEPLRGEGGRPRGWLVVVADLTDLERRAAQERLADGLAQLGELSAGVAHELRNSLASLSGWLALARREPVSATAAECLEEAGRETAALARVVEDFLAFARPGTRRGEPVDLVALVARAANDPALGGVAVSLELPERAPFEGDPGLLDRALRNLVANAARAERDAERSGPLVLSLTATASSALGPVWEIAVEDRGAGIPPAVRARLFEPFAAGPRGGAGLGLALARRIAVLHEGEIDLYDRPDGGTRAVLRLPRGTDATQRSSRETPGPSGTPPQLG